MHCASRHAAVLLLGPLFLLGCGVSPRAEGRPVVGPGETRVVLFVWDGLRPDSVNAEDTPNLLRLGDEGVFFDDHHATYPTLTMMNSASLATGGYPATNGFYGNYAWVRGPEDGGTAGTGANVNLQQPVFTEDYGVLDAVDRFYGGKLVFTPTLFETLQDAGVVTAAVGKPGAAYLVDRRRGGYILEERLVWPHALLEAMQAARLPVPSFAPLAYGQPLEAGNPDFTKPGPVARLGDGVTPDPTAGRVSPYNLDNEYLMRAFTEVLLPGFHPRLVLVWLRNPDSTEHAYGPGTAASRDALRGQDALLGKLRAALERAGLSATTDILVVSDHGHSSVSGPLDLFPLRGLADGGVTSLEASGYSVSGDVRTADLINRANLGLHAFDGMGCVYAPVLSGITASGGTVYPGLRCVDRPGTTSVPGVPEKLGPHDVVVVANGGSEYFHLPSRDKRALLTLVRFLQSREEYGPVFVARRYGRLPGTLPLDAVRVETRSGERSPDVVVSLAADDEAVVQGVAGTEWSSSPGNRGMHGTFSPRDVHNTLIAAGPHFLRGFRDTLPSGNVDVAPTVASLFGLMMPRAEGRVLEEALISGRPLKSYVEETHLTTSTTLEGVRMLLPTDPDGHAMDSHHSRYRVELQTKTLRWDDRNATYYDWARAIRD